MANKRFVVLFYTAFLKYIFKHVYTATNLSRLLLTCAHNVSGFNDNVLKFINIHFTLYF